jgi:hypothetical protein
MLVAGMIALLLAAESVRIVWASRLGKSTRTGDLRRAVSLDPANPNLHFRLGTAEVYNLEDPDTTDGTNQLRLATELSPHETRYWGALASACQFEGKRDCARHAIARALALSPMAPRIRWEAANYYLWANQRDEALSQFRRLLELDPGYAGATFRAALGAAHDPAVVYNDVLTTAGSPKLKFAYISFLAAHDHNDFAFQIWKMLAAGKTEFDFSSADPYLEQLIGAHKYAEALSVWNGLESRDLVPKSGGKGNLVFNGDFKHLPLNAGFDWRYHQEPYVAVEFAVHQTRSGKGSVRLAFSDVGNHQAEPIFQLVPVEANQDYVLTARVRSANIVSDSGPRLRVTDPACRECLTASSSAVVGTTSWHPITLRFRTGPRTSAVRVSIWRPRSLGYPTEILGTLLVDRISLTPEAQVTAQASPKGGHS